MALLGWQGFRAAAAQTADLADLVAAGLGIRLPDLAALALMDRATMAALATPAASRMAAAAAVVLGPLEVEAQRKTTVELARAQFQQC
jgi:hypothetical protein